MEPKLQVTHSSIFSPIYVKSVFADSSILHLHFYWIWIRSLDVYI